MRAKLGILAGRGELPGYLIKACRKSGRDVFVIAIKGETEPATVAGVDHLWVDVGAIGHTEDALKDAGCVELCLIGPIGRPQFAAIRPGLARRQVVAEGDGSGPSWR